MPPGTKRGRQDEAPATAQELPGDVEDVLRELGDEVAHITVWRMDGAKEVWCDKVSAREFSMEWLAAKWGGGKYRVRIAVPNPDRGNGAVKWAKVRNIELAGAPKIPNDASTEMRATAAGAPAVAAVRDSGMPEWVKSILIASVPVVAGALAQRMLKDPAPDPILLKLLETLGKGNGDRMDTASLLQLMEQSRAQGMELGERIAEATNKNSGGGEDSALSTVLKETLPPMMEMFREGAHRTKTATTPPRPLPAAAGSAPAAPTVERRLELVNETVPEWVARVRKFLPFVLSWADQHKTPEVRAAQLIDDLAEPDLVGLAVECGKDSFVADTFHHLPELAATAERRAWFTAFLEEVQDLLTPDDDEDEEAAGDEEGGDDDQEGPQSRQDRVGATNEAPAGESHGDES